MWLYNYPPPPGLQLPSKDVTRFTKANDSVRPWKSSLRFVIQVLDHQISHVLHLAMLSTAKDLPSAKSQSSRRLRNVFSTQVLRTHVHKVFNTFDLTKSDLRVGPQILKPEVAYLYMADVPRVAALSLITSIFTVSPRSAHIDLKPSAILTLLRTS